MDLLTKKTLTAACFIIILSQTQWQRPTPASSTICEVEDGVGIHVVAPLLWRYIVKEF